MLGRSSSRRAKQAASRERQRTATHFFSAAESACAKRAARRTAGAVDWARPWVLLRGTTAWNADTQSVMTAGRGRASWSAKFVLCSVTWTPYPRAPFAAPLAACASRELYTQARCCALGFWPSRCRSAAVCGCLHAQC